MADPKELCFSAKDLEQDEELKKVFCRLQALEISKNTLSLEALKPIVAIFMAIFTLSSGVLALWFDSKIAPVLAENVSLVSEISTMKAELATRSSSDDVTRLAASVSLSAKADVLKEVRDDLKALAVEQRQAQTKSIERISEVEKAISGTLTTDEVDSRLVSLKIIVDNNHAQTVSGDENVRGQFSRIVSERLQPQIDRLRTSLEKLNDRVRRNQKATAGQR